jgi:geranylgeranyl diphosphate synthase type II
MLLAGLRGIVEVALESRLPTSQLPGAELLNEAVRSAVYPGGKRMRPLFTLLAARAVGVSAEAALDAACAVEFLHSSSLVFDDLPCMDDAILRRDRAPLHKVFGEPVALLAGLALLNQAYLLFSPTPELVREAAECIGANGMIGGQALDIGIGDVDLASRDRKTTALMRLTLTAGALAGGAPTELVGELAQCGERLGRAYQMLDDLLDADEDERNARVAWRISVEKVTSEVQECAEAMRTKFGPHGYPLVGMVEVLFAAVVAGRATA